MRAPDGTLLDCDQQTPVICLVEITPLTEELKQEFAQGEYSPPNSEPLAKKTSQVDAQYPSVHKNFKDYNN